MGDTIMGESNVGKRLQRIERKELLELTYQGKAFPIVSQIRIGRGRSNHIRVDDALASRDHAIVQKIKDAYFIKDLDSTNGTYVNDHRVPSGKFVRINHGDTVKIGRTEITLR
jgi:pSer/pThr/pTyr-binding forkhead associated (FHA) protein